MIKNMIERVILITLIYITLIGMHETIHQAISEGYGCETKWEMNWKGIYIKTDLETCRTTQNIELAHAMNEIVGYTMNIIVAMTIGIWISKQDEVK